MDPAHCCDPPCETTDAVRESHFTHSQIHTLDGWLWGDGGPWVGSGVKVKPVAGRLNHSCYGELELSSWSNQLRHAGQSGSHTEESDVETRGRKREGELKLKRVQKRKIDSKRGIEGSCRKWSNMKIRQKRRKIMGEGEKCKKWSCFFFLQWILLYSCLYTKFINLWCGQNNGWNFCMLPFTFLLFCELFVSYIF